MKSIIFVALVAVAAARPDKPSYGSASGEVVAILRDDRVNPSAAGEYSFDTETADGITRSESGYGSGLADAEGYKPESSALPIAPAFPHPIPQFVLDQIAKAAEEDANRDSDERYE